MIDAYFEVPALPTDKPFDFSGKALGKVVFPIVKNMPSFVQRNLIGILEEVGILKADFKEEAWYDFEQFHSFYQRVKERFGPHTLFDMGKTIPEVADFPPNIRTLHQALATLNDAYHMNHKGGYIGFYHLVGHDPAKCVCTIQCYNPYDHQFDKGLLTALGRKFANRVRVESTPGQPKRAHDGSGASWYTLTYH